MSSTDTITIKWRNYRMAERFRVFKVDDMYGVSDDIAQYTVAFDRTKLIMDGLCELLNELNNENKELKEILSELRTIGDYQAKRINELNKENQRIEQTIKDMIQNERTELGRSVLKQLWEAIQ